MKLDRNQTNYVFRTVFEDNNGALNIDLSGRIGPITKQIEAKYNLFRIKVGDGTHTYINKVDSKDNISEIFTKVFQRYIFLSLRKLLMGW